MKYINTLFNLVTVILFVGMGVTVLLQIFFRFVMKMSVPWTEELSRLLFIYVGFFGTALAARDKQFIIIDVLFKRLPKPVQGVLTVITRVITVAFFGIMFAGAVQMYGKVKGTYFQSLKGVSNGMTYVALIIGAGMTILYTLLQSIDDLRKKNKEEGADA